MRSPITSPLVPDQREAVQMRSRPNACLTMKNILSLLYMV